MSKRSHVQLNYFRGRVAGICVKTRIMWNSHEFRCENMVKFAIFPIYMIILLNWTGAVKWIELVVCISLSHTHSSIHCMHFNLYATTITNQSNFEHNKFISFYVIRPLQLANMRTWGGGCFFAARFVSCINRIKIQFRLLVFHADITSILSKRLH